MPTRDLSPGKHLRMTRMFHERSGRSVVVAVDHGILGRFQGLTNLAAVVGRLLPAGPDAVLFNARMFRHAAHLWRSKREPAVVLGTDVFLNTSVPFSRTGGEDHRVLVPVREAVALGADALKVILAFGTKDLRIYAENLEVVGRIVGEAGELGLPVMIEATLWGELVEASRQNDPGLIANIARVGVELGADMLKLPFGGTPAQFGRIVEEIPVPTLILGGTRTDREEEVYAVVRQALEAGARGLVFGRNIWQHADPVALLGGILRLVHGESS